MIKMAAVNFFFLSLISVPSQRCLPCCTAIFHLVNHDFMWGHKNMKFRQLIPSCYMNCKLIKFYGSLSTTFVCLENDFMLQ
ncbi:hypothetical protein INR49_002492 [Caranx melampygus]|nr:hypothetical protein INR49_002492 [Caranx melampygus]